MSHLWYLIKMAPRTHETHFGGIFVPPKKQGPSWVDFEHFLKNEKLYIVVLWLNIALFCVLTTIYCGTKMINYQKRSIFDQKRGFNASVVHLYP